jgi:hypothetical protein
VVAWGQSASRRSCGPRRHRADGLPFSRDSRGCPGKTPARALVPGPVTVPASGTTTRRSASLIRPHHSTRTATAQHPHRDSTAPAPRQHSTRTATAQHRRPRPRQHSTSVLPSLGQGESEALASSRHRRKAPVAGETSGFALFARSRECRSAPPGTLPRARRGRARRVSCECPRDCECPRTTTGHRVHHGVTESKVRQPGPPQDAICRGARSSSVRATASDLLAGRSSAVGEVRGLLRPPGSERAHNSPRSSATSR